MTVEKIKRWADKHGWLLLTEVQTSTVVILRFVLPDGGVKELCLYPDEWVSVGGDTDV